MMTDLFAMVDELGPARIIHVHEPGLGLRGALVVDNLACGPAVGGLRMAADVGLEECRRLARAMTLKNAAAGLPHGGGKSILVGDPKMPLADKERLVRAFAHGLRNETDYIFGPDMGTNEICMAWVKDEIGRSLGLPRELGGIPLDQVGATGYGLARAAEAAILHRDFEIAGARLAIQGFGAVGLHAARFLCERGAVLVAASDTGGTLSDPAGLDVAALMALKKAGRSVCAHPGGRKAAADAIIDVDCDIWIPAARPDVIHEDNVERLSTRLILEGANIPITPGAEARLHEKGVLCVPDFIANAGGVICAAVEYRGGNQTAAFADIAEKVFDNTAEVLERAAREGLLPRQAALDMATARVRKAMGTRRFGIF